MLSTLRRGFLAAVAALCIVAALALPSSAATAGHPESGATCQSAVEAIDVSTWQGNIDWTAVAQRYPAAWIKVAGGDGGYYRDGRATQNVLGATASGVAWGTYYFAGVRTTGWQEADYAVSQGFGKGSLMPALDLEINPLGLSSASLNQYALDFINRAHELTGRWSITYTGAYLGLGSGYLSAQLAAVSPLWIANYGTNAPNASPCARSYPPVPDAWGSRGWAIWQHNSTSHIAGIPANSVDVNIIDPAFFAVMTGATVEPNANPSDTNDPAPADNVIWSIGSHGPKVAQIQHVVGVTADGQYGPQTAAAVGRWQFALHLTPDGVWGPATESRTADFFAYIALLPAVPPAPPTVQLGARGPVVSDLQRRLAARGYWVAADGVFGSRTRAAVIDWQHRNGLVADGIVGPRTWATL